MNEFRREKKELAYNGSIVAIYKDYLVTPDGKHIVYDYIHHKTGGGAAVLLVDSDECTYLVRQYRNSVDRMSLEMPAGGYSFPGESGESCAVREAEEETGYIPNKLNHISNMIAAVGTFDETTDLFIGTELVKGKTEYDENEFIEIVRVPVEEAVNMVLKGEINDSKTMVALFAYGEMKKRGLL